MVSSFGQLLEGSSCPRTRIKRKFQDKSMAQVAQSSAIMRKPAPALALVFLLLMPVNSTAPHQEPEIEANVSVEAGSDSKDASGEMAGEGEAVVGSTGGAVANISDQKWQLIESSELLPICVFLGVFACACLLTCCFPGDANAVHPPPQHKWHQDTSSEDYREELRRRERSDADCVIKTD